jgi:hypothetical protein
VQGVGTSFRQAAADALQYRAREIVVNHVRNAVQPQMNTDEHR